MERGWKFVIVAIALWLAAENYLSSRWAASMEEDVAHLMCWEHTTRFYPERIGRRGAVPEEEWRQCLSEMAALRRKALWHGR